MSSRDDRAVAQARSRTHDRSRVGPESATGLLSMIRLPPARQDESTQPRAAPGLLHGGWISYPGGCGALQGSSAACHRRPAGRSFPVALDYSVYVSPSVSPSAFRTARLGPYLVAIPAPFSGAAATQVLNQINRAGARAAGYVRFGDTFVPAYLDALDRRRVALSLQ